MTPPTLGDTELVERRVCVEARHVVYIKGILEASEGLAALFAERGGDLVLCAPRSRERELDDVLEDLAVELGAVIELAGDS
jgi:hypothetical protein